MENNEKYAMCEGGYGSKTASNGQAEQPMEQQVPEKQTNGLYRFGRKSNNPEALQRTAMIVDVHRRQWAGNQELQEEMRRLHMTLRMMRFGRKAPTAAELRAQWLEQQRHEEEIRQRFTTAEQLSTTACG